MTNCWGVMLPRRFDSALKQLSPDHLRPEKAAFDLLQREPLTALVLFFASPFVQSEIFISEHLVTRSLMFGSR